MDAERDRRTGRGARDRGPVRLADEWWESLVSDRAAGAATGAATSGRRGDGAGGPVRGAGGGAAVLQPPGGRSVRSGARGGARRAMRGASFLGTALAAVGARMSANQRFRRVVIGAMVLALLLAGTTLSVGVIVLNNRVIERSAELGRLDRTRRDLRTDNALMAAEIARLSAPPRIVALAHKRLGMAPSPTMTQYVYLDEAHRPRPPQRIDVDIARGMRAIAIIAAHQPLPAAYSMPSTTAPAPAAAGAPTPGELASSDPAIAGSAATSAAATTKEAAAP